MADLSATEATSNSCCTPAAQTTCCEPSAKADCCDEQRPSGGCGCDAQTGVTQRREIPE